MREGFRSPKFGHLGVYFLSTGPAPSPRPGERVQVVIYGKDDAVVRRFEHRRGECLDEGYTDFWNSPQCRPTKHVLPVVDIAPDGQVTTLIPHFDKSMGQELFAQVFEQWATTHGVP